MRGAVLLLSLTTLANADVMPSCGKREPRVAKAGDSCGGPTVCTSPTVCVTLDEAIQMPGWRSAYVCSKTCDSDAACDGLGIAMRCTGTGRVRDATLVSTRVCVPTIASEDASADR